MANIRSAEKQRRQAEKHKERNRAGKSRLRSALKKSRSAAAEGTATTSRSRTGFSEIDKAAKKGVIKNNTASRYKSRLSAAAKTHGRGEVDSHRTALPTFRRRVPAPIFFHEPAASGHRRARDPAQPSWTGSDRRQ